MGRVVKPVLLSALVVVGGCDDGAEEGTGQKPVDAGAVVKRLEDERRSEEVKEQERDRPFSYSPVGKRDPFRSYLTQLKNTAPVSQRKLQPTEKYELDQYRLTGLVTGTSQPKAMVEDPVGVGHTLRVGSRLGKNEGRVTRITGDSIVVIEQFVNPLGKKVRVPVTIKLPSQAVELLIKSQ